jgi:hypothetical protein
MKTNTLLLALLVAFLLTFTSCTDTQYIALDDKGNLITLTDSKGIIKDHVQLGADSITVRHLSSENYWEPINYRPINKSSTVWRPRRDKDGQMDSVAYHFSYKVIAINSLKRRR